MKAVPANQERTEITPLPFSHIANWEVNTDLQESWGNILGSELGYEAIGYLREFALSIAGPSEGMNGDRLAGIQQGARMVVEEILNMTKGRQDLIKANILKRRAAQVPVGMPPSKRLRDSEPIHRTRIDRTIEQVRADEEAEALLRQQQSPKPNP